MDWHPKRRLSRRQLPDCSILHDTARRSIVIGVSQAGKALLAQLQSASGGIDPGRRIIGRALDQIAHARPVNQPVPLALLVVLAIPRQTISAFPRGHGGLDLLIKSLTLLHEAVADPRTANPEPGILAARLYIFINRCVSGKSGNGYHHRHRRCSDAPQTAPGMGFHRDVPFLGSRAAILSRFFRGGEQDPPRRI